MAEPPGAEPPAAELSRRGLATGSRSGRRSARFVGGADLELAPILARRGRTHAVELSETAEVFHSTYYDTADLRLLAAGASLHHRRGGAGEGWQLRLPVGAGSGEELSAPSATEVPDRIRELVRVYVRFAPLGPVADLDAVRRRYRLTGRSGAELAVVVETKIVGTATGGEALQAREVELLDRGAGGKYLRSLREVLLAAGLREVDGSGLMQLLDPTNRVRPTVAPPARLSVEVPVLDAIQAGIGERTVALLGCDARVRSGQPDAVHQMRVTLRRLRSELGSFASFLSPDWVDDTTDELGWLAGELGPARELEVLRGDLAAAAARLPAEIDTAPLRNLMDRRLGAELAAAQTRSRTALRSERYLLLIDRLVLAAGSPAGSPTAAVTTGRALPRLVWANWKVLRRRGSRLDRERSLPSEYHRVRIAAKRCRYLAEAAVPVFGAPAKRFAEVARVVHEVLGQHQDALVASDAILRLAGDGEAAGAAFALGLLYADQQGRAARARTAFHDGWTRVLREADSGWPRPVG